MKIELSLFLTKYNSKKTYGGVGVWLHTSLIPTLGGEEWYVSCRVASSPGKGFISFYFKNLLHRNSLKYMWGYKIVPTTNLPHYHSKYSCE